MARQLDLFARLDPAALIRQGVRAAYASFAQPERPAIGSKSVA